VTRGARARVRAQGERGTITLWVLGCCLMVLAVGGLSLDLWRSFSERRALAGVADAAARAGASAIDEDRYRASGELVLVPELAAQRARASIRRQLDARALRDATVVTDAASVTVVVRGAVPLSLLRLVTSGELEVEVAAAALPVRS
jgi:Flp pilus assembly protein TadG